MTILSVSKTQSGSSLLAPLLTTLCFQCMGLKYFNSPLQWRVDMCRCTFLRALQWPRRDYRWLSRNIRSKRKDNIQHTCEIKQWIHTIWPTVLVYFPSDLFGTRTRQINFFFFLIVYSLLNIHWDLPVLFCIFFGLLGHILCRGLPNALFSFAAPWTRT